MTVMVEKEPSNAIDAMNCQMNGKKIEAKRGNNEVNKGKLLSIVKVIPISAFLNFKRLHCWIVLAFNYFTLTIQQMPWTSLCIILRMLELLSSSFGAYYRYYVSVL